MNTISNSSAFAALNSAPNTLDARLLHPDAQTNSSNASHKEIARSRLLTPLELDGGLRLSHGETVGTGAFLGAFSPPFVGTERSSGVVRSIVKTVSAVSTGAASQRSADKENGVGLLQGAREFGDLIVQVADIFATANDEYGSDAIETVGRNGRDQILSELGSEITKWLKANSDPAAADPAAGQTATSTGMLQLGAGTAALSALAGSASGISNARRALGLVGAAYSGYELFKNWGRTDVTTGVLNGAAVGAYLGSTIPVVGTLTGGAVGALIGAVSGVFKSSGKHADQIARDKVRSGLQKLGLLDDKFQITLADGTKYDFGKDGGFRLKSFDGSERATYNTDPSNPLSAYAISLTNPLAAFLAGANKKLVADLSGLLTNAAMSNASDPETVRENVQRFAEKLGLSIAF